MFSHIYNSNLTLKVQTRHFNWTYSDGRSNDNNNNKCIYLAPFKNRHHKALHKKIKKQTKRHSQSRH